MKESMKLKVKIKNVYGTEKIYPVCDKSKIFANIAGTTTLTDSTIFNLKVLGYTLEVEPRSL